MSLGSERTFEVALSGGGGGADMVVGFLSDSSG